MPKSAFQPSRKAPSKQDSPDVFFSPARKEHPFFQPPSSDTIQAQLEPDTISANMMEEEKGEETGASMEKEDEAEGTMEAPQEEEAQEETSA